MKLQSMIIDFGQSSIFMSEIAVFGYFAYCKISSCYVQNNKLKTESIRKGKKNL